MMIGGGLVGFVGGLAAGVVVGRILVPRGSWAYWLANVVVFASGVALAMYGLQVGASWLYIGGVGLIGGGMTGLKYGYGRVHLLVGPPASAADDHLEPRP
jgi:urocanate hydratase